ncbi:MAG TPA: aminotransferase class V-fold PLP-dependent enzyme [Candidatus Acidoferrales bacterium]|nr:aminotransferase class V-fold PLP-dependent enzyme [Candidatus Acidoferrales bacterium]
MKTIYFTPGPSALYPTVTGHFQAGFTQNIASVSHRSKQFQEIYQDLTGGLKKLLSIPDDYLIFIVGSGTEAMERTIQNCVGKYSFHFVNGSFSKRFFTTAQELAKKPSSVEVSLGEGFNVKNISIPKQTELICFTHNETSTGVMIPGAAIEMIAKKYPKMLVAVDTVSSAPYGDLDYKLLDVVFFSVQKLFGLPAGLGIMVVSPRAIKKSEELLKKGISIGSYHSFPTLLRSSEKFQTPETPPVLEMYVLEKVIHDMLAVGITKIRKETEQKAKMFYDFLDTSDTLSAFVKDKRFRSPTTIVVDIQKSKKDVRKFLAEKGFLVLSGYGPNKETQIRIANYPAHSVQDVKRLIRELKNV